MIVSGEAGVGKSSLLDVVAATTPAPAASDGSMRAPCRTAPPRPTSRSSSSSASCPRATRAWHAVAGTASPVDQLVALTHDLGVGDAGAASRLAPRRARRPPSRTSIPKLRRSRLQDAFALLLRALARRGPLVLAVEDLHWADTATVDLVSLIAGAAGDLPLLLIATSRPDSNAIDRVRREAIDATRARALTPRATTTPPRSSKRCTSTRRPSSSRPCAGARAATRSSPPSSCARSASPATGSTRSALPPTVESALSARLDRLEGGAAHALEVAAAIGTEIPFDLLDAAAALPELRAAVKQLLKADLLERADDGRDLLDLPPRSGAGGRLRAHPAAARPHPASLHRRRGRAAVGQRR